MMTKIFMIISLTIFLAGCFYLEGIKDFQDRDTVLELRIPEDYAGTGLYPRVGWFEPNQPRIYLVDCDTLEDLKTPNYRVNPGDNLCAKIDGISIILLDQNQNPVERWDL